MVTKSSCSLFGQRLSFHYGDSAARYSIRFRTNNHEWLCFRLYSTDGHLRWYFYRSPNGTPWAATYATGSGLDRADRTLAPFRKKMFGHGYDIENDEICSQIQRMNQLYRTDGITPDV